MFRLSLLALLLTLGCQSKEIEEFLSKQQEHSVEEVTQHVLKSYASTAPECSTEMMQLVGENEANTTKVVSLFKELASGHSSKPINLDKFKSEREQIAQIFTHDQFFEVLQDASKLLREISSNDKIMSSLEAVHQSFQAEDGDRLAEILEVAFSQPSKLQTLFEAARTWACSDYSQDDLLGFIYAPKTLWELGGRKLLSNGLFLVGSGDFVPNSLQVQQNLAALELPPKLKEFVGLLKEMLPKGKGICGVDNLGPYEKHFAVLYELFKQPEQADSQRPLRKLVNMAVKMYTMSSSNQCHGHKFDELNAEDLKQVIEKLAHFIESDETGLVAILKKARPRQE
ncbi:MAG: hypothetical protein JKY15_00645 [Deltaproteobacteria bacterium]|nr:hypothetical protein [Deltaproteobacteria bacterium]